MRIETASGYTILADDADYPLLRGYSWWVSKQSNGRMYASARVPRAYKQVKMHRLIMQPPRHLIVHHKNNNGLDNRRENLQVTTLRVNSRHAFRSGSVFLEKKTCRWRVIARDEAGKQISLGMYDTKEQAEAFLQNWNYRKMLELESAGTMEARHLAEVIDKNLSGLTVQS